MGPIRDPRRDRGFWRRLIQQSHGLSNETLKPRASVLFVAPYQGYLLPIVEVPDMNSARRLVVGAVVAAATAALWGPTAVVGGIVATGLD